VRQLAANGFIFSAGAPTHMTDRHCHGNGPRSLPWEMSSISFARHQYPPTVIRHAVWLYLRFTLSFRDVGDLLAERGLDVSYESVRRWLHKFGPLFARELRPASAPSQAVLCHVVPLAISASRECWATLLWGGWWVSRLTPQSERNAS
jgi:hypothetical protein